MAMPVATVVSLASWMRAAAERLRGDP